MNVFGVFDLQSKSLDWFLYDGDLRLERVNVFKRKLLLIVSCKLVHNADLKFEINRFFCFFFQKGTFNLGLTFCLGFLHYLYCLNYLQENLNLDSFYEVTLRSTEITIRPYMEYFVMSGLVLLAATWKSLIN